MTNPAPPSRNTSGWTSDFPYGPLAQCGIGNPFFYHLFCDDFDYSIAASVYTQTKTGNGTIAHNAGDGGTLLFTTNSAAPAATDICSIQLPAANFSTNDGQKFFFLARLKLADVVNAGVVAGLIQTTTTPFTVVDGVYFFKASGASNNLVLRVTKASANVDITIPTAAYTLVNNTNIDLGFYIDRNSQVNAFVGSQLVGFIPQSGVGSTLPPRGVVASGSPALPLAATVLNPTLAIRSGTTASTTMTADFFMAAKER